jgi:hypothetical protein
MLQFEFTRRNLEEATASIQDSIRPGLRRAYPLPKDQGDDRFQRLLEALAQHSERTPQDP